MASKSSSATPRRKRKARGQLLPGAGFTTDLVRQLLETHVLRDRWRMPADAELEKLTHILEGWRQHYLVEQNVFLPARSLVQKARRLIEEFGGTIADIEKMNEFHRAAAAGDLPPLAVQAVLEQQRAEITYIRSLVAQIEPASCLNRQPGLGASGWMWLAEVLPEDLRTAMKPSNPAFAGGLSHDGPVARFISAVAPILTAEHPTPGSVATQLKKRRKQGKTASIKFSR
jgi:hypothetical protein